MSQLPLTLFRLCSNFEKTIAHRLCMRWPQVRAMLLYHFQQPEHLAWLWNRQVSFYPGVEKEILGMPPKIQARMLRLLEMVEEHGANLGPPHTESMGDGLFGSLSKGERGHRAFFVLLCAWTTGRDSLCICQKEPKNASSGADAGSIKTARGAVVINLKALKEQALQNPEAKREY